MLDVGVDVGRGHVDDCLTAAARRDAVPVMAEDVRQALEAEVHVRHVADALDDECSGAREENVGEPGAVRGDDDDGRVEQSHGGVEGRRRVVGEERVGEVEVGGGASHRRLDRRLFRESTPPRPTHLPGERRTRLGPIGIRERKCAENYTK